MEMYVRNVNFFRQVDIETMLRLLALAAQGQTMGSRGSG